MARTKNPQEAPAARRPSRGRAPVADAAAESGRQAFVDPQQRAALIARTAYFRALNRGFAPGYELADWLAAEAEVDAELLNTTVQSSAA